MGARDRRPAAGPDPGGLRARRRDGGGERDPRRRHQAGVRPRPGDGRDRAGRRGADAGLVAVLAGGALGARPRRSPRSTSSSCATGRRRSTGTAPRRARRSLRRSSRPPAPATSRPTSASPAAAGLDSARSARGWTVHPISSNCESTVTGPVGRGRGMIRCVADCAVRVTFNGFSKRCPLTCTMSGSCCCPEGDHFVLKVGSPHALRPGMSGRHMPEGVGDRGVGPPRLSGAALKGVTRCYENAKGGTA